MDRSGRRAMSRGLPLRTGLQVATQQFMGRIENDLRWFAFEQIMGCISSKEPGSKGSAL
jgi:hypothetical protein